jgi:hypothetical protein
VALGPMTPSAATHFCSARLALRGAPCPILVTRILPDRYVCVSNGKM